MNTTSAVTVRLKPGLLRNVLIAAVVGGIPVFGVLTWLGVVHGTLPLVIGAFILVVLAVAFTAWRHSESYVRVAGGVIRKVTFASDRTFPVAEVDEIVICETDESSSPGTVPQLLALDADGERVFRMRGLYWTIEDMHLVADAVGAKVSIDPTHMTPKHFYAKYRGAAYWYEGRPWLTALGVVAAGIVASGLVLLMMTIAGSL